jgi:hypothetical protein
MIKEYLVDNFHLPAANLHTVVSTRSASAAIRSEATEFRYEQEAQPLPKIGPWTDLLGLVTIPCPPAASRRT